MEKEKIPDAMKKDFEKIAIGEMSFMEVAEKYGMTYKKDGKTYAKATIFHLFEAWKMESKEFSGE